MSMRSLVFAVVTVCSLASAAGADPRVTAGVRAYARGDYVRAAQVLTPAALDGDARAETYLGFMYREGRGATKDYAEAARWFHLAAAQGEPNAQFFLALLFDRGLGIPRDFVQAYAWLDIAAAHADPKQRDYWSRMRDSVANKLTYQELAAAQAQALAFEPKRER